MLETMTSTFCCITPCTSSTLACTLATLSGAPAGEGADMIHTKCAFVRGHAVPGAITVGNPTRL